MRYLKLLLLPFSWLYGTITGIRNFLYETGKIRSIRFDLPVVVVGNLTAGGTGKTPLIEYIIRLLKNNYRLAILSRGYKRQTEGVIIAEEGVNSALIGDEPFQIYRKFFPEVTVAVGEDRVFAVPHILKDHPDTQVILLDDAFQHRRIRPSFQIMVTELTRPFYKDYILPAGLLRESRSGAKRADAIVVTKCPEDLTQGSMAAIAGKIRKYAGKEKPVFFSSILYEPPVAHDPGIKINRKIILVTGIANPEPLVQYLRPRYDIIKHFRYPDHHFFSEKDIRSVTGFFNQTANEDVSILFTEKDYVRLEGSSAANKLKGYPVFFQPITYKFVAHDKEFDKMIVDSITEFNH
jgi:tetraacyldisaccharide 4'-kinase